MNYNIEEIEIADNGMLCEPIATYSYNAHRRVRELRLFDNVLPEVNESDIKVVELFAGVGGFRIGLESLQVAVLVVGGEPLLNHGRVVG